MRLSAFLPLALFASTALAASTGCSVHAQVGSNSATAHPAYLRALSDLREARAEINGRGGDATAQSAEAGAVTSIDRAIADIQQAANDDGKNVNDHPAVDANEPPTGRLHRALAALQKARADVNEGEDNPNARGLKQRAIGDIDGAINQTNRALAQF